MYFKFGVLFCKLGISKALGLHTGQAYDKKKTISNTCPSSEKAEFFFNVS